jgi:ribosomal protein S27AE
MSEYLRDSVHNDMRTCDDCGGAFYASRGLSEEEEAWTCGTCESNAAEIARLRAALEGLMKEDPLIYEGNLEARLYVTVDALEAARAALKALEEI